jgi:hypothetical protein
MQRLNHRSYSPGTLTLAVTTSTALPAFEQAAKLLKITNDLKISPRHLQTLCHEIGGELVDERRRRTEVYQERPLMAPRSTANPPVPLAVVMVDGGRMQTRQPGQGPGVHGQAWREDKTAVLLRMTIKPSAIDPQPNLPACFAQPLGKSAPSPQPTEPVGDTDAKPTLLFRTGVATLMNSDQFAWMTAAAAEERGFFKATAKAFVSDGQAYNWTIQHRHFDEFEPILDFVHACEHLHEAARATGEGAELGQRWAESCWQGRTQDVLAEIDEQRSRLIPPPQHDQEPDHPWSVLSRERGYLENNQERMDYPRYRREGLPITSSPIESWVKQINQRVKGSEKFWNDDENGEAILQLRAAWLSDDEALSGHLASRPGHSQARPRA